MLPDTNSYIVCGILSANFLTFYLEFILTFYLSDVYSDILSDNI